MGPFVYLFILLVALCATSFVIVFRLAKNPADRVLWCLVTPGLCWIIIHKVYLAAVYGSMLTSELDQTPSAFDRANWLYIIGEGLAPCMLIAITILFFKYLVKLFKPAHNNNDSQQQT